ncbi:MAG: L-rhamnose catabolism isomerase [Planctomycetes bacterium]|nr:L-rhamnose catabolism isomerase [Planctomycetota bacterium]
MAGFAIREEFIADENAAGEAALAADLEALSSRLARDGIELEEVIARAATFRIAVPSWGVGTGGTRFGRFPGPGEPRDVFEKLADCATIYRLVRITPAISLHIPWDRPDDPAALAAAAAASGLHIDAVNSNTFEDQPGQRHSYKFGSLTHTDPAVRRQAVEHNLDCLALGRALGARALSVWIADGSNFPGQQHFRGALERYLESLRTIYAALPADWRLYLEHKLYEPAFYSTVIFDWGTSYWCARELGDRALCLVDLGHHAPGANVEIVVSRLLQLGKLGGFHLNDSQYGDDDLDTGSIDPYRLFRVFHELVDAERSGVAGFDPVYMLDQSHNVTDPLESLMTSAEEAQRAWVQASLVDRAALADAQERNDAIAAMAVLKRAFRTDVSPVLAAARQRAGGAIDPVAVYRLSGYREEKARERPAAPGGGGSGIVG